MQKWRSCFDFEEVYLRKFVRLVTTTGIKKGEKILEIGFSPPGDIGTKCACYGSCFGQRNQPDGLGP